MPLDETGQEAHDQNMTDDITEAFHRGYEDGYGLRPCELSNLSSEHVAAYIAGWEEGDADAGVGE